MLKALFQRRLDRIDKARSADSDPAEGKAWEILHTGTNPTTDYYIKPEIARLGCTYSSTNLSDRPGSSIIARKLIIVRYLSAEWANWININKSYFNEVVYFMDDELMRPETWKNLPPSYITKLRSNFRVIKEWLPKIVDNYWVSTETLRETNPNLRARVVEPSPLENDAALSQREPDDSRRKLIFYHATAAHREEFLWLRPIIKEVLENNIDCSFEVIGDLEINRLFRSIPRTRVLHPMSWENYLAYSETVSGGLGLAPLLANEFNKARSIVKRYDITRMAADGLYTSQSSYVLESNTDRCIAIPNDPQAWIQAIARWAQSTRHRHS